MLDILRGIPPHGLFSSTPLAGQPSWNFTREVFDKAVAIERARRERGEPCS